MSYLKEGSRRGLIGALMALFASYTMLLLSIVGKGIVSIDSSMLLQHYAFYAFSGFYLAGISMIFSIDEWSLLKQVTIHIICTLPFLPLGYYMGIMPKFLWGQVLFVGLYLSSYILSFVLYRAHLRKQARLINESL